MHIRKQVATDAVVQWYGRNAQDISEFEKAKAGIAKGLRGQAENVEALTFDEFIEIRRLNSLA